MNIIQELTENIKKAGFRVFIAESKSHGFYTDNSGSKLISFQNDLSGIQFSGNYRTSKPSQTGSGWILNVDNTSKFDIKSIFNEIPPYWATAGSKWAYTTLEQHLKMYGKSSKYKENLERNHGL